MHVAVVFLCVLFHTSTAMAQSEIAPPQGYIGFQRMFPDPPPVYWNGTQRGHYAFDYEFELANASGELAGTFWANNINFHDSEVGLPANHVGGAQGGYLGVQVKSATESIAIFSIWWALDARAGAGAQCVDAIEAWYNDDRPFDPPIHSMAESDPTRQVAGGPFRSCRLPINLAANEAYRLRLYEIADAREPDAPEWWGASFINVSTGDEQLIGRVQVPGAWGWLGSNAGGFIEHFGPMPAGCDSIPASSSTFLATQADNGSVQSSISATLYGKCEASLRRRSNISCAAGRCDVELGR
jgi:hypothetical protein